MEPPQSSQYFWGFQAGIGTIPEDGVVRIFPDVDVVVPGEYLQRPSLRPPSCGLWQTTSPRPMGNASLIPRYTNTLSAAATMKEIEPESLVLRQNPRLRRESHGSLEFGFTGSHFSDKTGPPSSPVPREDDILLNSRDDQGLHGSPQLSFNLDSSELDFTFASVDWTHRTNGQANTPSLTLQQKSFSELLAPSDAGQHLSASPYDRHYGGGTTSSTTSNSFVHLTPQGSSRPSLAQSTGSRGVVSLESDSAGEPSPQASTPGCQSLDNFHNSPLGDPPQARPHVGPSRKYDLPPKKKRGRKPNAKPCYEETGVTKRKSATRSKRTGPLSSASKDNFRVVRGAGGACRLCHYMKCQCLSDPNHPNGSCLNCPRPALCYRYSVMDASLYREQDAPYHTFSKRWTSMDLVDMTDWASNDTRTILVSQVSLDAPFALVVRRFIPRKGDRLEKRWHKDGVERQFPVPPYAIVNMAEAAESIETMIRLKQPLYLQSLLKQGPEDHCGDFLWETYMFAFRHPYQVKDDTAALLMTKVFRLWVACRFTSHPEAIIGAETLGMRERVEYPSSHWNEHFPTPPVINAQLECILYSNFLRPLSTDVQKHLDDLLKRRTHDTWLSVYLALFVLLHSCAMLTKRDAEYARQNNLQGKYANPEAIREHQKGAITLLAHFHGVLGGPIPFGLAGTGRLESYNKKNWNFSEEQETFMRETYLRTRVMGKVFQQSRQKGDLSDQWYWVSQLYDENWTPDKMD